MKHLCAWCNKTIHEVTGGTGVSHGICQDCRKKHFPETLRSVREQAQALVAEATQESTPRP